MKGKRSVTRHASGCQLDMCSLKPNQCVESKEKAQKNAAKMAKACGPDFLPKLAQSNCWFALASSKDGRWEVQRLCGEDGIYTALLGDGFFAESGDTPTEAIENTMQAAVKHVAGLANTIGCYLVNKNEVYIIGPESKPVLSKKMQAKIREMRAAK